MRIHILIRLILPLFQLRRIVEKYNKNIGKAFENFEKTIKKAGFSFDSERKILSVLMSLEYQVERGEAPPISVICHLKAAVQSWIESCGKDQKSLLKSLNPKFLQHKQ
jgi:hypothetical protein